MTPLTNSTLQVADAVAKSTASMNAPHARRMAKNWSELTVATGDQLRCYWDLQTQLMGGQTGTNFTGSQADFYHRTLNNHVKATVALASMLFPFATVMDIEALSEASQSRPRHAHDSIELVTGGHERSHVAQSSKPEVNSGKERMNETPQLPNDARVAA